MDGVKVWLIGAIVAECGQWVGAIELAGCMEPADWR